MGFLGLWRVRLALVAGMLAAGCLIVASVGAGVSVGRSNTAGQGKVAATRALRTHPVFGGGRGGFSPTAAEMRASSLRTRHAVTGLAPSKPGAELPWLRHANSQTFEAGSGRMMTRIYPYPVNYKTASGSFAPIDTQLITSGSGYAQAANNLGVELPKSASGNAKVSDTTGGLSFGLVGASGTGATSGTTEKFTGALPGVDLGFASLSSGIGWQTSVAATSASQTVRWLVHPSTGLTAKLLRSGVAFETADGKIAWEFAAPSAHVAGSDRPVPTTLSMHTAAQGVEITVSVARAKGASATGSRHFAAFDPQVEGSPMIVPAAAANPSPTVFDGQVVQGINVGLGVQTGDCYVDSGSPDTSYCLGDTNYVGPDDHTLINFDIADSIPAHVQVLQAYAAMTVESESSSTAENIGVWQAAKPWNNFATWNSYDGTNTWDTPGGDTTGNEQDYNSIGAAGDIGGEFYWNIHTSMQGWVDGNPSDVDGLYFAAEAGASAPNTLGFYTETAAPAHSPYLQVYYEPRMGAYAGARYDTRQLTDRSSVGVNVGTGNLLLANTDLSDQGINGLNLTIDRDYNNLSSDQDSFGIGWSMSTGADTYLSVPCDGSSTVAYFDGTGSAQSFWTNQVTGQPVSPPGVDARLTMDDGDSWSSSTFTLSFRHAGITEVFTAPDHACGKIAKLSSLTDINGNKLTYGYNGSGQLTSIVDSYGNATGGVPADHTTTISYSPDGYVSEITDPTGRAYHYYQNGSGQLTEYKDPAGHSTYYTYDSYGNLTQIKTAAGNITNIAYDAGNTNEVTSLTRLVAPTDSSGPTWSYQYATASGTCPAGDGGTQGTVSDPNLHVTTYCTDDMSRIVMSKDANGHERSSCYSPDGFLGDTLSGAGTMISIGYNGDDSVKDIQQGGATTETCNGSTGDASGPDSTFTYPTTSGSGVNKFLPQTGTDDEGNQSDYIYDASGNNLHEVKDDSTGTNSQATYNADGTVATTTDADNNTTTYSYTDGNLTTVTPPTIPVGSGTPLNPIHLSYDSANRVTEVSSVSGTTGREVDYSYDDFDHVTQAVYKNAAGTTVATISYEYDNDGNLTQRTQGSAGTTWVYDGLNRLTSEYLPSGATDYYNYDPAGNLTSLNVPGGIVIYGYDKANELTSVTDPGGSKPMAKMTYDADGNLLATTYASGASQTNTYNSFDQLTGVNDTYKTSTGTLAHLTFGYDYHKGAALTGLVQKVTDQSSNATAYTYDTLNRLTEAKTQNSSGTTTADYNYSLDGNGNITKMVTCASASACSGSGTTTTFAYNPGNESCWMYSGASSGTCSAPPTGADIFTYDSDGNQTSNGNGLTASYNALGQTTSITSAGTTTNYSYLGEGQGELVGEGSTTLNNDVLGLGETTSGTSNTYYTRALDGTQLDERAPGGTYNYLYDGNGSVVGMTDSSGHLVKQYAYDPYGNTTSSTGTVANPFGFQDGYQTTSGQYHFGQRFLNPTQGTWSQVDPAGGAYGFADDDPINEADPSGEAGAPPAYEEYLAATAKYCGAHPNGTYAGGNGYASVHCHSYLAARKATIGGGLPDWLVKCTAGAVGVPVGGALTRGGEELDAAVEARPPGTWLSVALDAAKVGWRTSWIGALVGCGLGVVSP